MSVKPTAVLICPGRGTYNKGELGTLHQTHGNHPLIAQWDALRRDQGQASLSDLDGAERFSAAKHTTGDNASALIYACSFLDAEAARQSHDIRAVAGNSLGWYIALAAGGGTTALNGLTVVNTMGTLMHHHGQGGQVLYPFVDGNWQAIEGEEDRLNALVLQINAKADHTLAISIHLGGMLVVAGNEAGLVAFEKAVATDPDRKALRLPNHAAFHTSLMGDVAQMGRNALSDDLFQDPEIPLIDGRGAIWNPRSCDLTALRRYTLGHQITESYDFTASVQSAARNFAPERFVITGPGTTLGGAVAQALIAIKWQGIDSKEAFMARQATNPLIVSMGREDQRALVV
ncbi:ACP S-malonyltransferase [Sulfitobacter donghicola]|uniref:[acyl-carrier-protein] S-malonyltransferase n=1 Tax=Sulfitobacter donghicola DSW-25 = KCTC 12864 = JCM 14565 TaxID=1300350 RepID=A0A073IGF0_9RHOB|nr:ACP S-malonyltransferase [Sulfitobacter donghicola]KEJ88541.1 acyl carrier protein [Sulfitobacter donghicola DSW-25 = KCTC 12864 = JCM 14565]KIN69575.1 Malonyl CoA-acyl carrier protein transacylase [Sulfitobacter donghicola DSW-25 = KCTC 12864 = JCM 14565]